MCVWSVAEKRIYEIICILSSSVCALQLYTFMCNIICKSRGRIVFPSRSCDAYNIYIMLLSGQNRVHHNFAAFVPRSITIEYNIRIRVCAPRLEVVKYLVQFIAGRQPTRAVRFLKITHARDCTACALIAVYTCTF